MTYIPVPSPRIAADSVISSTAASSSSSGRMRSVSGWRRATAAVLALLLAAGSAAANTLETSAGPLQITEIARGFDTPWSFGFLPDGNVLVTERGGRLLLLRDGAAQPVSGLPASRALGQGGLLDVMVPRDFAQTRHIWLTYSGETGRGLATMAGRGRLSEDGSSLEGFETLFTGTPAAANRHFGARLVEAADGSIYITTGDRGTGPGGQQAQDPSTSIGAVIHLDKDGGLIPAVAAWAPGIHSIGHRNIQGAALMPDGSLLVSEHGAKGGDEINLALPGRNYGWPVISYGVNYNGSAIGSGQAAEGMEQPLHYWDPSIAPSGLVVYSGRLVPDWQGDVLAGSLNSDFISRLDPDSPAATGWAEERLQSPETARVRDLREAPDGAIWFLSESNGALYRLAP